MGVTWGSQEERWNQTWQEAGKTFKARDLRLGILCFHTDLPDPEELADRTGKSARTIWRRQDNLDSFYLEGILSLYIPIAFQYCSYWNVYTPASPHLGPTAIYRDSSSEDQWERGLLCKCEYLSYIP